MSIGGGERHLADLSNGLSGKGYDIYIALSPESPLRLLFKDLPGTRF
jgi:hypothetical protein